MRILVISNLYPPHGIGGYEERCKYTVDALRERGHEVHVLTSDHFIEERDSGAETNIDRLLKVHGFYGHPWLPIHKLYKLESANQKTLQATMARLQPDIVHVWNMGGISKSLLHTLEASPTPLLYDISDHWIARSLKADVWLSWWNDPGSTTRSLLRSIAQRIGLKKHLSKRVPTAPVTDLKFENIYFCSQFMRDLTASKGYPVSHASIVYCGVLTEAFSRKQSYQNASRFLWVGRLAEDKDPLTTVRGFLKATEDRPQPMQLDLYGKGDPEYTDRLQREIDAADAGDRIRLKSANHEAMRQLYAGYDAYIFSSNWGEPFALTPLEAMAAGLPVIMCPDGGDAELLEDGINALGFSAGDPNSLAVAIDRFVNLNDFGKAMSETALEQVQSHFSMQVMCNHIESHLKTTLSQ